MELFFCILIALFLQQSPDDHGCTNRCDRRAPVEQGDEEVEDEVAEELLPHQLPQAAPPPVLGLDGGEGG